MHLIKEYARPSAFVGMVMWALIAIPSAQATPALQLYIEDSTYDTKTESWIVSPSGSSVGGSFRLWTIGNVAGPGGKGTIKDVRLSAAYDGSLGQLQIVLTPATTDGFGGFTDPSTPVDPGFIQFVPDAVDAVPLYGDGRELPTHEEFVPGIAWQEFNLGDFDQTDSPIADFITSFPSALGNPNSGQINVYDVTVLAADGSTAHGARIHFDLYDHVVAKNHISYKFAPFSHDVTLIPAPSAAWASLPLFFGLAVVRIVRRHFRQ